MRLVLVALLAFLGVTAIAGGIGLLTHAIAPPLDLLRGSAFASYRIPGLVLLVVVGGSAAAAGVLVLVRHRAGALASIVAATMILAFEIVEIATIGSDEGVARTLQSLYLGVGVAIAGVVAAMRTRRP